MQDETAILACAAYVDLNPIRAAVAQTIETSPDTSALRDVDLAKNLMEPMFSDGSWHLGIEYDQSVFRNQALLAAGRVDPVWAAQMARTLAVDYGGNDESRRLEIYCSILEGIAQKRQFRGRR